MASLFCLLLALVVVAEARSSGDNYYPSKPLLQHYVVSAPTGGSDDDAGDDSPMETTPARHVGDPCTSDDSCADVWDSSCTGDTCQCNDGYVALSRVACLPQSAFIGDFCSVSAQCIHLNTHAVCYKERCLCEPHYYIAAKDCPEMITTTTPPSSTTTTTGDPYGTDHGDYVFSSGTHSMPVDPTVDPVDPVDPPVKSKVTCQRKRKLGETCCATKQCSYHVWDSECKNNTCTCLDDYVPIGSHSCARKATALGDACAVDSQCQDIDEDSECKTTGECWCNAATTPSPPATITSRRSSIFSREDVVSTPQTCLPHVEIGGDCVTDGECLGTTPNSNCAPSATPPSGTCVCDTGFIEDSLTGQCVPLTLAFSVNRQVFQTATIQLCCQMEAIFLGSVGIAPLSTDTATPTFSVDSTEVSVDANGDITLDIGATISANPTLVTVTATSSTLGTLLATTIVELRPDPCCTMPPTNPVTAVQIIANDAVAHTGNCENGATLTFVDLVGNSIMQGQINVDEDPNLVRVQVPTTTNFFASLGCDNQPTLTGVSITNPPSGLTCTLNAANMVVSTNTASLPLPPGRTCTIAGTVGSCNGMTTTFSIALTYVCSN